MAGTCNYISPHGIGSTVIERSQNGRTGAPFSVRIITKSHGATAASTATSNNKEGPSCIFVGPIETASKETLEALYRQARDAYYSGEPLIVDDMFDKVELKLRWYGSKSVVKYPRCSIRQQSTYADAEVFLFGMILLISVISGQEDPSQVLALASIWIFIFGIGSSICLVPMIYTVVLAYQDAFSRGVSYGSHASVSGFLTMANVILFMAVGALIGYPVASASVKALHGLWRNDLVALKGACPNCGEEVFAFVRSNQTNISPQRADCHVCESLLEFRTKVEQSSLRLGRQWVYGRIYLLSRRNRRQRFMSFHGRRIVFGGSDFSSFLSKH